jgi:adenosylhomocysteine nucleosidase
MHPTCQYFENVPETSPTVVVLTALPVEYDAVRAHIQDAEELVHDDGTRVERGRLAGTDWTVVIAELGEGAVNAAALTMRVISWLRPEVLLFVGVAGGLKDDVEIGDVVVGTKVYAVQGGKQTPEGFHARPEVWHGSHRLVQAARSALRDLEGVRGHRKPIACGDVVLADDRSAFAEHIRRTYNDAYAIEMEGSGAAHAAHLSGQLDALVIRGISDRADAAEHTADAAGSQEQAAGRAASVAVAVLHKHLPRSRPRPRPREGSSDSEERPHRHREGGATYGGDHIDFRGGTFYGPVTGRQQ